MAPAEATGGGDREVYLQVYRGRAWPPIIHTGVRLAGDTHEWTFGSASRLLVNGSPLHGVIPEIARCHDYGDWQFWKAVPLGRYRGTAWPRPDDPNQRAVIRALASGEECFADGSYRVLSRNCWDFSAHLAAALVGGAPRAHLDLIHGLNDRSLGVPVGTTGFVRRRLGWGGAIAACVLFAVVLVLGWRG